MKNTKIVYSTDPKDKLYCSQCRRHVEDCVCHKDEVVSNNYVVIFRLEKSGRGGKTVTVIDGWPKNEPFIANMCKELKTKCGVGGTYKLGSGGGIIEIQGDKREVIKKILNTKSIKFKGM